MRHPPCLVGYSVGTWRQTPLTKPHYGKYSHDPYGQRAPKHWGERSYELGHILWGWSRLTDGWCETGRLDTKTEAIHSEGDNVVQDEGLMLSRNAI